VETYYTAFGLTMSGISSKAAGKLENKNDKFQGQPLDDDLGLNWYGFKYRNHDPQIGRFIQIDPLSEKYVYNSTYAFSENKVTNHIELEGLESVRSDILRSPLLHAALKENVQKELNSMRHNGSEAIQVKGSVGAGFGIQVKVTKKVEVDLSISGPQTEVGLNGSGKVDAKASLVGTSGKVSIPGLEMGVGAEAGAFQYADGKFSVNAVATGADINSSKSKTDGNLSQSGEMSAFDAAITVGAKLGAGGVSVTVDVLKAGKAVVDFFKAGINWMSNVVKDKAPSRPQKPDLNNQ
jgi:RHS repeat-associated protein